MRSDPSGLRDFLFGAIILKQLDPKRFVCIIWRAMKNTAYSTTDKDIRPSLKSALAHQYGNNKHARIVEELGLHHGQVRVDVAVINGSLHGFEIKSDRDTLKRLGEQMRMYNSVLDYVTLVVGTNHVHEALEIIPAWWGVTRAEATQNRNIIFEKIREAKINHSLDILSVVKLLWREEALDVLETIGQDHGVRSKPRSFIYGRLASALPAEKLKENVRGRLMSRKNWRCPAPLSQCDDLSQLVSTSKGTLY